MAKKKYRIYKAGGAQGQVMNPTAQFLARAQQGMQQPSEDEMLMMQQQGQPQMSEQQMMMQQEQQMQMLMDLIEQYAELTQSNPEEIFEMFQQTQDPNQQKAMIDQMVQTIEKANAGSEEMMEEEMQPMSKGGYVQKRIKELKKAQEGMETEQELEASPTINDTPDGREALVSGFNQSLKDSAQTAVFKQQAQEEFDSGNYQLGGGKERRQQRRTNRRLRRAFKDIPMAYGINQFGVPSSGINVFAPAMMQLPSQQEIIKSENAENSEVTNELNPQGINIKGNMKYGLFGRPKRYEFEMTGAPGAFTPFMGGMFGTGVMGTSTVSQPSISWQDPVSVLVKQSNAENIKTNADEEQEMRDDPSQPSSDADIKEKLEKEKRTILADFTEPYEREDGTVIMTNPNAANIVSMEDAPMTQADVEKLSLLERLDLAKSQGLESVGTPTSDMYYDSNTQKLWDSYDQGATPAEHYEYLMNNMDKIYLDRSYPLGPGKGFKAVENKTYADYIEGLKEEMEGKSGEYTSTNESVNVSDASKYNKNKYAVEQYENATEEEKAELERKFQEARKKNPFRGEKGGIVKAQDGRQVEDPFAAAIPPAGAQPMLLTDIVPTDDTPAILVPEPRARQWWKNIDIDSPEATNVRKSKEQEKLDRELEASVVVNNAYMNYLDGDISKEDYETTKAEFENVYEQYYDGETLDDEPAAFDIDSIPESEFDADSIMMSEEDLLATGDAIKSYIDTVKATRGIDMQQSDGELIDSLGILDDPDTSAALMQHISNNKALELYLLHEAYQDGKGYDTLNVDQATKDTLAYIQRVKAGADKGITAEDLKGELSPLDYIILFGTPPLAAAAAYKVYQKYGNRLPKGATIKDFGFKTAKALPGKKATVTPMFQRKALPPGPSTTQGSYSKQNVTAGANTKKSAPKVKPKGKPSYYSRFKKFLKPVSKFLSPLTRITPMVAPVEGLFYTDPADPGSYEDFFQQQFSGPNNIPIPGGSLQSGGYVDRTNPDLYRFTGGGQDFMQYGGIPLAQDGYASVSDDLTDEERMEFSKTPEFADAARFMLEEGLEGVTGDSYDEMYYNASDYLNYDDDKGEQLATYYDDILTNQGPAAFQNAINEGQDSYISAIPFAENNNPFPAEIISNPQMEALENYTAPEDLRQQGYLSDSLNAQEQFLAPGEQYTDFQLDMDYQYGGPMFAQNGAEQDGTPDNTGTQQQAPVPGFTMDEWNRLSEQDKMMAIRGMQDARNVYSDQRLQNHYRNRGTVQQGVYQGGFNPLAAFTGALTGMPYGMGTSRQKLFENKGGYWKQTGFPTGTIDPSNITRIHTEGKRGLFGPKGKMDIYFGGSGEAAADGVPAQSTDGRGGFGFSFEDRAQRAINRKARRDARPGERQARQDNRLLNKQERQHERNRRRNIMQGKGDTGAFDRESASAKLQKQRDAVAQTQSSTQQSSGNQVGYSADKLDRFKSGEMGRRDLRKMDFNRAERRQYREGDVEGASEARKNRRRAARKQYGGYYIEGGEYDLSMDEILEIMQAGGQIEFI